MTRQILIVAFLTLAASTAIAQITVSQDALPQEGDTVRIMVDNLPMNVTPGITGGGQSWDFNSLTAPFAQVSVFEEATAGSQSDRFPQADLVVDIDGLVETYYRVQGGQWLELGLFGSDPLGFGLSATGHYTEPLVLKNTPLAFGDFLEQSTSLRFPMAADELPDTLLDMLPVVPDSLRLRIDIERRDDVDAWGELMLANMNFEVLRQRRIEMRRTRIDAKLGPLPWQDISSLVSPIFPGIIRNDTIRSYHFYDDEHIAPLVVLTVDEQDDVQRADFVAINTMTDVNNYVELGEREFFVYPNPTVGMVRFDFINFEPGMYNLKVMNILGVPMWESSIYVDGNKTVREDLSFLRRGTYLYAVSNGRDKRLLTKRLVIIKP